MYKRKKGTNRMRRRIPSRRSLIKALPDKSKRDPNNCIYTAVSSSFGVDLYNELFEQNIFHREKVSRFDMDPPKLKKVPLEFLIDNNYMESIVFKSSEAVANLATGMENSSLKFSSMFFLPEFKLRSEKDMLSMSLEMFGCHRIYFPFKADTLAAIVLLLEKVSPLYDTTIEIYCKILSIDKNLISKICKDLQINTKQSVKLYLLFADSYTMDNYQIYQQISQNLGTIFRTGSNNTIVLTTSPMRNFLKMSAGEAMPSFRNCTMKQVRFSRRMLQDYQKSSRNLDLITELNTSRWGKLRFSKSLAKSIGISTNFSNMTNWNINLGGQDLKAMERNIESMLLSIYESLGVALPTLSISFVVTFPSDISNDTLLKMLWLLLRVKNKIQCGWKAVIKLKESTGGKYNSWVDRFLDKVWFPRFLNLWITSGANESHDLFKDIFSSFLPQDVMITFLAAKERFRNAEMFYKLYT